MAAAHSAAISAFPEGYYDCMDGLKKEDLKAAAGQCVRAHSQLVYYDLPNYWIYSDVYPELVNGCKRWWDMYSDNLYLIQPGLTGKQSFSANRMQREHAVPKSWWKANGSVEYTPAYSDMWNLYPSDADANQAKLNYPFGETRSISFDNGISKVGLPKSGYGGGASHVFEPADEYKGDFARAIFYMATVYDELPWAYTYMFVRNSYPSLLPWAYNMLLQWARLDPVSQKEIDRNDYVQQFQGNRNPFIDFPELAEYIWGQRTSQVFKLSEQGGSGVNPPITGDPEISAPVNGEALDFGPVAAGYSVNRALQIKGKNMTSPLSLRVVGADKNLFTPEVTSIPADIINQNGGFLLNIKYNPLSTGNHEAKLTLYDGGIDGSIAVTLTGQSVDVPALGSVLALPATDITDNSYTANWKAAPTQADYYTLTRVRYNPDAEEIDTYETSELYYNISDRNPLIPESYYVTYNYLGVESPLSNSIYIAASGINDPRSDSPFHVFPSVGGVIISRAPAEAGTLFIMDICGRIIDVIIDPEDNSLIPLSPGIYIMRIDNSAPLKVIVR